MRFFERQEGETTKAWEAFKVYRDMGKDRSLAKCAETYYGSRKNLAQLSVWSKRYDWVDRAQAHDDYYEMIKREAIEGYQLHEGADVAQREAKIQEELLEVKELILPKMKTMAKWPLERRSVEQERTETEDGQTVINNITHIYPARWSHHTLIKMIEVLDDTPDKIAFTDPSGQHEYGQSAEDVRRMFRELVEEVESNDPNSSS